jgi:hypothetical protein
MNKRQKTYQKSLAFPPVVCKLSLTRHKPSKKMKGGKQNENRKNHSETEGRGSGLPYGKRRGS